MNPETLDQGIQQMHNAGAGHIPRFVSPRLCRRALAEVDEDLLQRSPYHYLNAEQFFRNAEYEHDELPPTIRLIADHVCWLIRSNTTPERLGTASSLTGWYPDEFVLQLYDPGIGISWHTDESHNSYLLTAIWTLRGQARFRVERSSLRWVHRADWRVGVGDLVLLRGVDFQHVSFYGRPRHKVDECSDDRLVLIMRQRLAGRLMHLDMHWAAFSMVGSGCSISGK